MTPSPPHVILTTNSRVPAHVLLKDQLKSNLATKFIGIGAPGSSTDNYRKAWGDKANCADYSSNDIVFVSMNGNRRNAVTLASCPELEALLQKAVDARVTFITDVPQDRKRSFNSGERDVAKFLIAQGYSEVEDGVWNPI